LGLGVARSTWPSTDRLARGRRLVGSRTDHLDLVAEELLPFDHVLLTGRGMRPSMACFGIVERDHDEELRSYGQDR
jgi:hypothetical protein